MVKGWGGFPDESSLNPSTRKAHLLSLLTEGALSCGLMAVPESYPEDLRQAESDLPAKGKEGTSVVVGGAHGTARVADELGCGDPFMVRVGR